MATPGVRVVKLNPARVRIWINRLAFCTRTVLFLALVFVIAGYIFRWLPRWAALVPSQVGIFSGVIHFVLSFAVFLPLLERFEAEHGTLNTFAVFFGPFSTIPAALYVILSYGILGIDSDIRGVSVWMYVLLACEAIKVHRANPAFKIGDVSIPTYLFPLPLLIFTHFVLPVSLTTDSILLNLLSCGVGYAFELGYLKILLPPERILRAIEGRLNLLGRLPHYVSIDQKTFGRYGVLPTAAAHHLNGDARGISPARFVAAGSVAGPSGSGSGSGANSSSGTVLGSSAGQGAHPLQSPTPSAKSSPPVGTAPGFGPGERSGGAKDSAAASPGAGAGASSSR